MASRFFGAGSSSSDEESSSGEDEPQAPSAPQQRAAAALFQFSDDEEDTKRIVRSAKDKRFEELETIIKQIKNHKKIKDMGKVLEGFEDLGRAYKKAGNVIEKEGIPRFYVRCLVELEDFVNECWEDREGRKAMSKNNSKSLSTMRQRVRKYNKDFEIELANYRENPDLPGEEEVEASEAESSDEEMNFRKESAGGSEFLKSKGDAEESSDEEDFWGSSDESESSSSSDDEKYGGNLAAKFLRKTGADAEKEREKEKKKRERKERKIRQQEDDEKAGEWEVVKQGAPMIKEKPKMFAKDADITHEAVVKKLHEILAARGKKGTDRSEQIELLHELTGISETHNLGTGVKLKLLFSLIVSVFDYNPNVATCMKAEMWQKLLDLMQEAMQILIDNPNIVLSDNIQDESEVYESEEGAYRVRGCLLSMVERMDEEFTKMLQACDAHSTEYVERLKDEKTVCTIVEKMQEYLESRDTSATDLCRIYIRRIEHMYYKFDYVKLKQILQKEKKDVDSNGDEAKIKEDTKEEETQFDPTAVMDRLCKYIYTKDMTDRIRTRAILCHIYHHALHDCWYEARDLQLMSHLQDTIHHSDIPVQILYNRTMVQLGLCAFRHGSIRDAHNCLLDIQSGGRAKELLAQGLLMQRQQERRPEQEKIEKQRQMPFHMHINLELLECVYLVSAMLLEIPYMAAHEFDPRRRMISKSFHHQLKIAEKQTLTGPPESMREHVVAASKAMKVGDWRACRDYILSDKMKVKVWNLFPETIKVCEMIKQKIQEESLRTYLFTYSSVYDSLSLITLSEMFEMEKGLVHSIISKMIINEELMASLDEPTQTVVMHRTEPSRLQSLALQLSEKISTLVENNEKLLEMKQGTYGQSTSFQRGGQRTYQDQWGRRDQRSSQTQSGRNIGRQSYGRGGDQQKSYYGRN